MIPFFQSAGGTPTAASSGALVSSLTWSVTVPASVLVGIVDGAGAIAVGTVLEAPSGEEVASVTFDGVPLERVPVNGAAQHGDCRVEAWELRGTWDAGFTGDVVVTYSAAVKAAAAAKFYFGPSTASLGACVSAMLASGTSCTVAVPNGRGDTVVVFAGSISATSLSVPPPQTSRTSTSGTGPSGTAVQFVSSDVLGSSGLLPPVGVESTASDVKVVIAFSFREGPMVTSAKSATTGGSVSTTLSTSFVARGGPNRAVVVAVAITQVAGEVVSTATFGAQSLSSSGPDATNGALRLEVWKLAAPVTSQQTVTVTLSAAAHAAMIVFGASGVDQTTPIASVTATTDAGTTISEDQTVGVDDLAVAVGALIEGDAYNLFDTEPAGSFTAVEWDNTGTPIGKLETAWAKRPAVSAGTHTIGFTTDDATGNRKLAMLSFALKAVTPPAQPTPEPPESKVVTAWTDRTNIQAGVTLASPDPTGNYLLVLIDSTSLPTAMTANVDNMTKLVEIAGQGAVWGLANPDVSDDIALDATGGSSAGRAHILLLAGVDTDDPVIDTSSDSDAIASSAVESSVAVTTVQTARVFSLHGSNTATSNAIANSMHDCGADQRLVAKSTTSATRSFSATEGLADGVTFTTSTANLFAGSSASTPPTGNVYVLGVALRMLDEFTGGGVLTYEGGRSDVSETSTLTVEDVEAPDDPTNLWIAIVGLLGSSAQRLRSLKYGTLEFEQAPGAYAVRDDARVEVWALRDPPTTDTDTLEAVADGGTTQIAIRSIFYSGAPDDWVWSRPKRITGAMATVQSTAPAWDAEAHVIVAGCTAEAPAVAPTPIAGLSTLGAATCTGAGAKPVAAVADRAGHADAFDVGYETDDPVAKAIVAVAILAEPLVVGDITDYEQRAKDALLWQFKGPA